MTDTCPYSHSIPCPHRTRGRCNWDGPGCPTMAAKGMVHNRRIAEPIAFKTGMKTVEEYPVWVDGKPFSDHTKVRKQITAGIMAHSDIQGITPVKIKIKRKRS